MYLKHGTAVVWHDNNFASSSSISQSSEATLPLLWTLLPIPKDIHSNTCRWTLVRMETWLSFLPCLHHLLALFPVLIQKWSYATALVGQLGCYYVLKIATVADPYSKSPHPLLFVFLLCASAVSLNSDIENFMFFSRVRFPGASIVIFCMFVVLAVGSVFSVSSFILLEMFSKTCVFMSSSPQMSGNPARENYGPWLGLDTCLARWRILWLSHVSTGTWILHNAF